MPAIAVMPAALLVRTTAATCLVIVSLPMVSIPPGRVASSPGPVVAWTSFYSGAATRSLTPPHIRVDGFEAVAHAAGQSLRNTPAPVAGPPGPCAAKLDPGFRARTSAAALRVQRAAPPRWRQAPSQMPIIAHPRLSAFGRKYHRFASSRP